MNMPLETLEAVRAIHIAAFGATPQPDAIKDLVGEVGDDPAVLRQVASRMYQFAENTRKTQQHSIPDHSQNGELRILLREIMAIGQRHGIIVDAGALGRWGSNSYDLMTDFGWKGVLIEANPGLIAGIRRDFGQADYALFECAVGPVSGRQMFHLGPADAVSSLIHEQANSWGGASRGEIEVEVRLLQDILSEAGVPHDFDVLDLDIEGMDVAVMNGLIQNSAYRPRLVIIEASFFFTTKTLGEVGLSNEVDSLYRILDKTQANLILGLKSDKAG
jgi:FkbM family methyltransferase